MPDLTKRLEAWIARLESKRENGEPSYFTYRAPAAIAAWKAVERIHEQPGAICVSVGGGPARWACGFTNLNIEQFPNVDVVANAYALPYPDASVDAVLCVAVLEHLEFPDQAVAEIARVLKPGGQAYFDTPFLQPYHGFPDHYQNLTLSGQEHLVRRHGLAILSSGASTGPAHVFYHIVTSWFILYAKRKWTRFAVALALNWWMRPRDRTLTQHPAAHALASTTYIHAQKP